MKKINTDALNEKYGESSFEAAQDARDVKKALIEWDKETIPFTIRQYLEHPFDRSFTPEQMIDFAKFYAQRCGVVLDGNSEIQNNH